ncbi:hypothetical protein A6A04_00435 [Paramagnetospirillum marisnigri]|uniref:Uncharacterized protein n=1 Tax=Paramagnetospirillum marisnigri TaxID=1285242 RepID=A0A178MRW4_9PROT|nr:hypothetical protein [Paramagnetospirillum marisnigri]OAN52205.1 hypothetical protein A6A04_00435 [Paramagnetospirillum marisnigri]
MFGLQATAEDDHKDLDDDALDQIEGEALIVVENPERYSPITVEMARRTLAMIHRLRRRTGPQFMMA